MTGGRSVDLEGKILITPFDDTTHRSQVITLWQTAFGYDAPHNAPGLVIDKKLAVEDGLFFVAVDQGDVIGTVMAGYDGHRGWIYSVAVAAAQRHRGVGSALLAYAEKRLTERGCLKINLQIMAGNAAVEAFYHANGYATERRISMGKALGSNGNINNDPRRTT
jgi:ribosomal protein S18 acetylase RimI-like enzyme